MSSYQAPPDDSGPATKPDERQESRRPSARARYSIILIGTLAIGSIGCMCAFIFTIALL